jgi:hypothetical protein
MTRTSTWIALQNATFSKLWFATVVSGTCVSAHDTAATWVMNRISHSTLLLSLMSTAATLPFFLFTLPAGALADMADRKKMLYVAYVWLAVSAGGLAILGWLNLLTPYAILASVFLIGMGFAFNAPAFAAVVPEIVSDEELPSASTLGGLQLNVSGIIGPALGGLLLPLVGANTVFALNALCFLGVLMAIAPWKPKVSSLPLESFFESVTTAIRYVRYSHGIRILLIRNAIFSLFIASIPALRPVVGMNIAYKLLHSPKPRDGPVLVTIEFEVDRSRGSKFVDLMREVRLIHLRNGAYTWQLFEDPSRPNTFRIEMMVPSWTQYLLQQERMTKADREITEQAEALHVGPNPPERRMYLGVNRELLSHKPRRAERSALKS